MNFIKRCWAEISLDNLLFNLEKIKNTVGEKTEIMCVVKANAYGHGDKIVVREAEKAGVRYFAVASADEAAHLRALGSKAEIIILGACLDDCFQYAVEYNITLSVCDIDFARRLSAYAVSVGKRAKVHIKLNTGMSRVGFDCLNENQAEAAADMIEEIVKMNGLSVCGVFTHFSVSDEIDGAEYTQFQLDNLNSVRRILDCRGIYVGMWHCANSGAIVNNPEAYMDMVRPGILLYGLYNGAGTAAQNAYKPVLELKTVITQIREIDEGMSVGYGRAYTAKCRRKTAVISIGYGDGYPRSLSGQGRVLVNGRYAPIIGRVCMDQTVIDITGIDCSVGDTVTVIGVDGENFVSADEIADIDKTINYEIVCGLALRVPRIYLKNGRQTDIVKYI
jgi:alanine racemase